MDEVNRDVEINDVNIDTVPKSAKKPIEISLEKHENLTDPLLDLEVKVNNPIGRLWLALKRIWKSQKTTITLRLTIPLLVLPIVLFLGYRLWMGRGVNVPLAKIGVVHTVEIAGKSENILILPSSDVYLLHFTSTSKLPERIPSDTTVVVFGMYSHLSNQLTVDSLALYDSTLSSSSNQIPLPAPTGDSVVMEMIRSFWQPISSFLGMFE